jgi:hypothetical protein
MKKLLTIVSIFLFMVGSSTASADWKQDFEMAQQTRALQEIARNTKQPNFTQENPLVKLDRELQAQPRLDPVQSFLKGYSIGQKIKQNQRDEQIIRAYYQEHPNECQ